MLKEKTSFKERLFRSKFTIVAEVLILVLISAALAKEVARRYQLRGEIKQLQTEAQALEKKNSDLSSLISQLSSGAYKEEQARLQLGLQKQGESVVVVLGADTNTNQDSTAATADSPSNQEKESVPNPKRWWNYFFVVKNNQLNT